MQTYVLPNRGYVRIIPAGAQHETAERAVAGTINEVNPNFLVLAIERYRDHLFC